MESGRYHSLDALRSAMMLLGLVLHSGASYTASPLREAWPYQDAQTSVVFDLLLFFIHLFRMPVFFVVAGFFGALLYGRDGTLGFVRNRTRRVLLPLLLFWFLVPLSGLGFLYGVRRAGGDMPFLPQSESFLTREPVLGHLWFLYYLLIFYAVALVVLRLADRTSPRFKAKVQSCFQTAARPGAGVLAFAAVTFATLLPMNIPGLETAAVLVPPLRVLAGYGVFFAFGWLLYLERTLVVSFDRRWSVVSLSALGATLGYLSVLIAHPFPIGGWRLTALALASLSIWLLIYAMVGIFVRWMGTPYPAVRYLSDASYWMYLVHLVPAVWLPALLARSTAPAGVKFALVLAGTTLLSVGSYHLFVRSTRIGQLLNGRRRTPSATPAGV